jgi:hypothetical protein
MAFRIIANTVFEKILKPEAESSKLFTALDYPLPYLGAKEILNNRRAVSVYFVEGNFKGSMFSPLHKIEINLDLFAAADSQADLKVLERNFQNDDFSQTAKRSAMILIKNAESRVNFLLDELIDIVFQIIMRKENYQLGVDRLQPAAGFSVANRMIKEIVKGNIVKDEQTASLVTMRAQMILNCQALEKVTGQPPVGPEGGGAEFHTTLEVNEDTLTKAGVIADTTTD